jgi:hypothetical protein
MSHRAAGFGTIDDAGGASKHRGRDHEIATEGILVVQVRPLGAISREVSVSAAHETLVTCPRCRPLRIIANSAGVIARHFRVLNRACIVVPARHRTENSLA